MCCKYKNVENHWARNLLCRIDFGMSEAKHFHFYINDIKTIGLDNIENGNIEFMIK